MRFSSATAVLLGLLVSGGLSRVLSSSRDASGVERAPILPRGVPQADNNPSKIAPSAEEVKKTMTNEINAIMEDIKRSGDYDKAITQFFRVRRGGTDAENAILQRVKGNPVAFKEALLKVNAM